MIGESSSGSTTASLRKKKRVSTKVGSVKQTRARGENGTKVTGATAGPRPRPTKGPDAPKKGKGPKTRARYESGSGSGPKGTTLAVGEEGGGKGKGGGAKTRMRGESGSSGGTSGSTRKPTKDLNIDFRRKKKEATKGKGPTRTIKGPGGTKMSPPSGRGGKVKKGGKTMYSRGRR
jgi:hypothetical protein